MSKKSVQRSITMTQEMRDRLVLLVSKQPRDTTEADVIREAIRLYLESAFAFHLNVLIYLLAALEPEGSPERIADAIIAARRDGETLLAQMQAVREMKAAKR
jgi:predicted DNA-binding protein